MFSKRFGKYQLDHEEVLQTLCYVVKGISTSPALIKITKTCKAAVSGKLNVLIRAHYIKAEENEKDRRFKYFLPDYNGLQNTFVKKVKARCEKRLREIQKKGANKEELAVLEEPEKFLQSTYSVFDKFNQSQQGKILFKRLFKLAIQQKDFVDSIDEVFEGMILVYSTIIKHVPENLNHLTKKKLESVMACCIVARKLNLFVLEEEVYEVLKENE